MRIPVALTLALAACWLPGLAHAQTPVQTPIPAGRAMLAIVGDAELFNVGQDGYCGERTTLDNPSKKKFLVPAGQRTWFFLSSTFRVPSATYTCSGDYSFVPVTGKLHILRYSYVDDGCLLEHFSGDPGKTPEPADIQHEKRHSCLAQ